MRNEFVPLSSLPVPTKETIADSIRVDVDELLEAFDKVEVPLTKRLSVVTLPAASLSVSMPLVNVAGVQDLNWLGWSEMHAVAPVPEGGTYPNTKVPSCVAMLRRPAATEL